MISKMCTFQVILFFSEPRKLDSFHIPSAPLTNKLIVHKNKKRLEYLFNRLRHAC